MDDKETARGRLTEPSALNGYIRVTPRFVWLLLAASILLFLAAGAWGLFGTLEVRDPDTGAVETRHPIYFVTN